MIGRTLGRYRVLAQLGAGGMGVVYRAHDDELDRDVALKFISPAALNDPAARARLLREARAASALNHPGICHIFDIGHAEDQDYIAMELVSGSSLDTLIPPAGFPTATVIRYGIEIAD